VNHSAVTRDADTPNSDKTQRPGTSAASPDFQSGTRNREPVQTNPEGPTIKVLTAAYGATENEGAGRRRDRGTSKRGHPVDLARSKAVLQVGHQGEVSICGRHGRKRVLVQQRGAGLRLEVVFRSPLGHKLAHSKIVCAVDASPPNKVDRREAKRSKAPTSPWTESIAFRVGGAVLVVGARDNPNVALAFIWAVTW
jgi:hypothetical protein